MALAIETREVNGVTILDLDGRITLGEGTVELRYTVRDLVADGARKILLNLAAVDYVDSSGLGELVSAFTTARSRNAELKLVNLSGRVQKLLNLTRLSTVFDIHDNEAQALASFK